MSAASNPGQASRSSKKSRRSATQTAPQPKLPSRRNSDCGASKTRNSCGAALEAGRGGTAGDALHSYHGHHLHHRPGLTHVPTGVPHVPTVHVPTGVVHVPRRGIFWASELTLSKDAREWETDFPDTERVCLIRFPPGVAALLRERVAAQLEQELAAFDEDGVEYNSDYNNGQGNIGQMGGGSLSSKAAAGNELGLTITPTAKEDYRVFDVEVERELGDTSSAMLLTGVLVELPCVLEAYKSFEGDLLFKSNDVSQMLYVFDATIGEPFNLSQIRDEQLWEWHSGLTPATHRIRRRKFKNFRVFDKVDVAAKERELYDIIHQTTNREQAVLEASTEDVCERHLEGLQTGALEPNVVAIVGPENPIFRAALDCSSAAVAVESGQCDALGRRMLRHLVEGRDEAAPEDFPRFCELRMEERLKFSVDANMNVTKDEVVRDDLSERLFGEYGMNEEEEDELMLEDDYQLDDSIAGNNKGSQSSDSSLLSSDDDVRKSKVSKTSSSNNNRSQ